MKTLLKQKRKHTQAIEVVFLLMLLFWVWFVPYMNISRIKATTDWEEIEFKADMESVFAINVNPTLLGVYQSEKNEKGVTYAEWYAAETPGGHLIGIRFADEDMDRATKLMNAQIEYEAGTLTEEELQSYLFEIQGWISPMEEQEELHYQNALGWRDMSAEQQALCLSHTLTIKSAEDVRFENIVFVGGFLLSFGLWFSLWIKSHTMIGEKMIRKYIKNSGNEIYAKEKISQFFETAQIEPDFWLDASFVAGLYEGNTVFGESTKLAWIYLIEGGTTMSGNIAADVAVAATKSISPVNLMLVFEDKKGYIATLNGGIKSAERLLELIAQKYPWIITEYSDELEHLYKKNWEGFLRLAFYPNRKEE